jgi:hypothetical protein
LQPCLCLSFLAGRRGSFGLQLFDDVEIPGGLVVVELPLGDVAGKGELLLVRASAFDAAMAVANLARALVSSSETRS